MADLVVPALGESITEAVVARWLKRVGESAAADEPIVDLETDKITVQLPAPVAGVVQDLRVAEGDTVTVGQVIGTIQPGAAAPAPEKKPPKSVAPAPAPAPAAAAAAAAAPEPEPEPQPETWARPLSPSQRRARRENGQPAAAPAPAPPVRAPAAPVRAPAPAPAPAAAVAEGDEVVPMTPLRKRIAERLVQAQQTAAILTTFNEVDMTNVMELRARYQDEFVAQHGIKLGFMSFFIKAAVAALQKFPGLNAEIRETEIVYKKHYDIGVAVGGGKGLVVPVIRGCDRLSFAEIEQEIIRLAGKAKDNSLALEDLQGGTFTVSNGGIYGSMMSTPILNFPQTGILGMHNIVKRAVVIDDQIAVRPMMYLAVSYDHRIVDGREAVQFLIAIKQRIEQPDRLLFSL